MFCVLTQKRRLQFSQEQSQRPNWDCVINRGVIIFRWASCANGMGIPPTWFSFLTPKYPPSSTCPCPWDLWCFGGVSAFLVTPVAPAQSQSVGYSLKSMWRFPLLHWLSSTPWNFPTAWFCQWSRPSFCKAMSDCPISAKKRLPMKKNKLHL